jgi:molybdenum cofactor synthesis domain-containing protein
MAAKVTDKARRATPTAGDAPRTTGAQSDGHRHALVITVSDGVAAGTRQDRSGDELANRLGELGFAVDRATVPDARDQIERLLRSGAERHVLILTTGGTGLTPRDVTPQATKAVLEYEVPGLPELMRADGGRLTRYAYLSRAVAGVLRGCLVVNVPGNPRGAIDSLTALEPILDHALATLAGPFDHDRRSSDRPPGNDLP